MVLGSVVYVMKEILGILAGLVFLALVNDMAMSDPVMKTEAAPGRIIQIELR